MNFGDIMKVLAEYKIFFLMLLLGIVFVCIGLLAVVLIKRLHQIYEDNHAIENRTSLKLLDISQVESTRRSDIIRQIMAPDAVDPAPNGYFIINDGVREAYVRNFTISSMPQKTIFNYTFAELLDFPTCTSSIFIAPIPDREMSKKLDNQINILESEHIAAKDNTNRQRKLEGQYRETEAWAEKVESGEEKFFKVGFLFSIFAESIEQLNRMSAEFHSLALAKGINISSCYAVQAEAYASNLPLNHDVSITSKFVNSDTMDRKSLSTVFNYTEATYTHRDGIPLGRDMFTKKPFVFDIFDSSHDGFLIVAAGKTGSGKSAAIKMMVERYAPQGYRFVCIDSQQRKGTGEGEYAALAEVLDGINFQISVQAENVLNPFEVHETVSHVKNGATSVQEVRTLELTDKILLARNDIRTMMQDSADESLNIYLNRVITDCISDVYNSFGIYDRKPESLYEVGNVVQNGVLTSGLVPKKLPTLSDFYRRLLCAYRDNKDPDLDHAYKLVIYGIKDYVRELYYSEKTMTFFTREEYLALESDPTSGSKIFVNEEDQIENVIAVKGVRPYFDGQSNLVVSESCKFTNIDISPLIETERVIAREIAINYVTENFIKGNAKSADAEAKMVAIFDESHENFKYAYARASLADSARTARKYHSSLIFLTQTIEEFSRYKETGDILKQAAVKMVFKQAAEDREHLKKVLQLTDAQVELIVNYIGVPDDNADEETKNRRRGEMCVVDNSHVTFVKVDYLKQTERMSVDTSAEEIAKIYTVSKAG